MQNNFLRWLIYAPIGLLLVGLGLSIFAEAAHLKHNYSNFWQWFGLGTLSLVIINAGLAFLGQSIIYRVRYEIENKMQKKEK